LREREREIAAEIERDCHGERVRDSEREREREPASCIERVTRRDRERERDRCT
jgi:hypothetical protein